MAEPTYTITITETERAAMARGLGMIVAKLTNAPVFVESPTGGTAAARALLSPAEQRRMGQQKDDPEMANRVSPPAAAPNPAPIEPRDRWARDRKGNEVPNPEGAMQISVYLWKADPKPLSDGTPRMQIAWKASTARESGQGNCFDEKLFPWLAAGTKNSQPTTIYIVHKGKYTNIVGVRA